MVKKKVKEFIIQGAAGGNNLRPGRLKDEGFAIVVAGGSGVWMGLLQSAGGFGNSFITREIRLPESWDSLKAKYGTMVPVHQKY